jgi:hypothetical protein
LDGENQSAGSPARLVPWVLAGLSATAFLGAAWITADVSPLRPDTASYLYFDPSRPIGYPVFLWLVGLFGTPLLAVPVQMLILTVSLFLLGWTFYKYTGNAVLSGLLQLALLISPEMWKFSASLITEAPATAAVALWCAQLIRTLRRPSVGGFGLLTIISGVAMLVKPSLIPMFLGTGIAVLLLQSRKERSLALITISIGLVASLAVTPIGNLLLHGSTASGSPLARGMLQHSLFCPPSQVPADPDSVFVEQNAKTVRDYISSAPDDVQPGLKRLYTGKLRFGLIIPTLGRRHGLQAGWQTDTLLWKIARQRISANPGCYARSVIGSFASLATYKSSSAAEANRLDDFLQDHPPPQIPLARLLPRDEQMALGAAQRINGSDPSLPGRQEFEAPTGRPLVLIMVARLLYATTAVIGIAAVLLLLAGSKLKPEYRQLTIGIAALGVLFHGVLGLTAIVELHLTRYTVPVWPVVCTLLGLIAFAVLKRLSISSRDEQPSAVSAGQPARTKLSRHPWRR